MPVVELDGVGRSHAGPVDVHSLRPTTLRIHPGEHVAVVGPSGSGKSTLLHLLGLMDRPTAGSYLLDGRDTTSMGDRERSRLRGQAIGLVFQAFHLLGDRTVLDNVALGLRYVGSDPSTRLHDAEAALDRVGLADHADRTARDLSGGEQQRVALARALVSSPRLVLADEPTGNLDSTNATVVLGLLEELHDAGETIVVVTHDDAVAARASRRLRVRDGVVHED